MKRKELIISPLAYKETIRHIRELGYSVTFTAESQMVHPAIAAHPDVFYCRMGAEEDSTIISSCITEKPIQNLRKTLQDENITNGSYLRYPKDSSYNAACTGTYLIHRLDISAPEILEYAEKHGMILIDVPQGYAKCSTVIVDENSIITYDRGIAKACAKAPGELDVLLIEPGHVALPGMGDVVPGTTKQISGSSGDGHGFLGGASGRVGREVIFNGDLSKHPDFLKIRKYIEDRGLSCYWIKGQPLQDIGSIV